MTEQVIKKDEKTPAPKGEDEAVDKKKDEAADTQKVKVVDKKKDDENPGENDTSELVPEPQKKSEKMRPKQIRRLISKYSAVLVIGLPTLMSILYFSLVASDQYATEVRFAVRGVQSNGGSELLGFVTGISSSGSTTSDSYILMDYIHSRAILEKLAGKLPLKQIYGRGKADFLSLFDMDQPIEELVKYWKGKTTISYDSSSQIIVVEVRAFSPIDSKMVAGTVLKLSEDLVNELSAKSRSDTVSKARIEVDRMEKRLRISRKAVRAFREKEQVIDPSKTAESRLTVIAELEGKLSTERAKLSALSQFMEPGSPRIIVLTGKIKALEKQMNAEKTRLGKTGNSASLTGLLEDYRELLMDQEFSEKAYLSALASLEASQLDASRNQRYLATFVRPSLPELALYPKRLLNIFLTFIISIITWTIGTLIVYSIRDHAA